MQLTVRQATTLLVTVFIISICAIVYELIVGTLSSYLLGDSVTHFSITIGLFLSAMGLGSYASRWISRPLLGWFILVEILIGLVGGLTALLLYAVFATTDYYYPAMITLILTLGSLIGMEIPLLTRLMTHFAGVREALANVLAFDYLGALLASLLFPLILLPNFGLLVTAFATGLLNMVVVLVNLWTFRRELPRFALLLGVTLGVTGLLTAGVVAADPLTRLLEAQLYADPVIFTQQTPYQRIVMTRWGNDIRLFLDGNIQFSLADEYRYHEPLVHPAMTLSRSRERVLVLGGGDGLAVREILKYPDVQQVVVVDIDPAMTQLARDHITLRQVNQDALHDPRVQLVHQDAFHYVQQQGERFGVIISDLPDPNSESLGKLYSREFYTFVQQVLGRGGVMVTQATSPYFAREAYWSIAHTMQAAGLHTLPYHTYVPSFGDWGFVLASADGALDSSRFQPLVPVRYFTPAVWTIAQLFDTDMAEVAAEANVLDTQVLLRYYQQGWQRWN